MKTGCIQHPPKTPIVILTQDYLDICDDNHAAAIILKSLEYWTDVKSEANKQIGAENQIRAKEGLPLLDTDTWIYKTHNDFIEDSLGLLKLHKVKEGLNILLNKSFISKRNNPKFKWDRTLQYRLNIPVVQSAINNLSIGHIQPMEETPVTNQNDTGNEAIPEITTEITTERKNPTPQKNSDYLTDVLTHNGKISEATAPNPNDQWFEYSNKFIKAFNSHTGRYPNDDEKDVISKLVAGPEASFERWEQSLTECNINFTGHKLPVARVIEVYKAGGTWAAWQRKTYGRPNGKTNGIPKTDIAPGMDEKIGGLF